MRHDPVSQPVREVDEPEKPVRSAQFSGWLVSRRAGVDPVLRKSRKVEERGARIVHFAESPKATFHLAERMHRDGRLFTDPPQLEHEVNVLQPPGRQRIPVKGEIPNPINPPDGCAFNPRCPLVFDLCHKQAPDLIDGVACHAVNAPVRAEASA